MSGVRLRIYSAVLCALCLTGVARSGSDVGFVDLPALVAAHPLHAVLGQYAREIAALRVTQDEPRLARRSDADAVQARAERTIAAHPAFDRAQEDAALAEITAGRGGVDSGAALYAVELNRETNASLAAFERATAQRNQRAYAAREQELRESELTLAYALARRDAARHLILRIKLGELYLTPARRKALELELSDVDQREAAQIAAAHRGHAGILAGYSSGLQRTGALANAQMASQLRAQAAANLDTRRQVSQAEANASSVLPDFAGRVAFFRASYGSAADARAIAGGFHAAGAGAASRFEVLAASERESRRTANFQIERLEAERAALYRSIVAQVVRVADRLGRQRGLHTVSVGGAQPKGSVDLTPAARSALARLTY